MKGSSLVLKYKNALVTLCILAVFNGKYTQNCFILKCMEVVHMVYMYAILRAVASLSLLGEQDKNFSSIFPHFLVVPLIFPQFFFIFFLIWSAGWATCPPGKALATPLAIFARQSSVSYMTLLLLL